MQEIVQPKSSGQQTNAFKKRRIDERVVVAVKIEGTDKRHHRNEGSPSDCWSWRKYGQKPIKGSPYPRGYYRCSTSKGCSAKKQVEISKTDASMLIITYTSNHNHPGPDLSSPKNQKTEQNHINSEQEQKRESSLPQEVSDSEDHFQYSQSPFNSTRDHAMIVDQEDNNPFHANHQTPGVHHNEHSKFGSRDDAIEFRTKTEQNRVNSEQEQETETILTREISNSEDQFQYNSTTAHAIIIDREDDNPFQENHQTPGMHYSEHSKLGSRNAIGFSSEENDFFDELEELPTSSFFTPELL